MQLKDASHTVRAYRFGVFEVELSSKELRKQGLRLRVQGQPIQILIALLESPGEVVTREALRQRLWPNGTYVEFDQNLNTAVNRLREALSDDADAPRFIETLSRRGYRFLAPVEVLNAATATPAAASDAALAVPAPISAPGGSLGLRQWLVGVAGMLLIASGVYFTWPRIAAQRGPAREHVRLVVLPFETLTGSADEEYLSDGLTEEMIAHLSTLAPKRLEVIARTSAMHYKGTRKTVKEIGEELDVDYVLESSVRRSGKRLRITAQLIHARSEGHVWVGNYEAEFRNILDVHREVALALGEEIQLRLASGQKESAAGGQVLNPEAHEYYLKGRYHWNQRTVPEFLAAIKDFQQAIAIAADYAQAYSGVADSYALLASFKGAPYHEAYPKAGQMASKAIELNEGLAEAHTSLGFVKAYYDWKFAEAEKEFRRALELNPNYATGHHWYGMFLSQIGRHAQALAQLDTAARLDPLSIAITMDRALAYRDAGHAERAIEIYTKAQGLDPDRFVLTGRLPEFYADQRRFAEAEAENEKLKKLSGTTVGIEEYLGYQYAKAGQPEKARQQLQIIQREDGRNGRRLPCPVSIYAALGEKEKALACLEAGYKAHADWMVTLNSSPVYDGLRSDARFQDLLRRLNFPQ
ncbi:MAG TPA: winged helix-turn-helix domain-containing protein [Methylococcaceae bacterium]|nr:winged helix-turn-helix domain-containing protein [Methylococcaceae bacterium]